MTDSPPPKTQYLLLSRGQWNPEISRAQIQTAIDSFYAWHERLVAEGKFLPGHRLKIEVKLVSQLGITDGPFTESKEVIGGYWFILADSLEEAARIAADNPCIACGLSFEIRELEPEQASAYQLSNETPR
ncbi:YciI family protein [Povalibacter sp.]|uniref:YciI family protein n=1 Tax=Povalibacter sp. TaxID=1962978 RepID=UPI002F3EEAB5